jgi:hypothetical protein
MTTKRQWLNREEARALARAHVGARHELSDCDAPDGWYLRPSEPDASFYFLVSEPDPIRVGYDEYAAVNRRTGEVTIFQCGE